jgi:hypothetical protein
MFSTLSQMKSVIPMYACYVCIVFFFRFQHLSLNKKVGDQLTRGHGPRQLEPAEETGLSSPPC